ncbi:HAMP domain-containing protein [Pectobacterium punjabense]|uniref:HAMP domain-containing protein n=1 Tax=Pectobacterium punjabense TaxID=2108399 RepID=A0ABX6KZU6_9GAMM|nr:methyl-accepting chemotaxis protein [Pectobacterium punjabense]MBS4432177.1 MCP four helix bundle domain-containing protein [Pectobacterium punjabense]PTA65384.1 methyl-accepting chemotaxis protein [Pectobacterium punjabense]QJA19539.1 HAMP domain-containing protein [Pectobacterium punjabense]
MRISTRLNTGFGAGMLIVAIIGFISTVNLSSLNNQVEKIVQTLYPTTAYANTLISEINNVFVEQSAFFINEKPEDNEATIEAIKKHRSKMVENLDQLQRLVVNDPGLQEKLAELKKAHQAFSQSSDNLLQEAKIGNKDGLREQALNVTWPLGTTLKSLAEQFIDESNNRMTQSEKTVHDEYHTARLFLLFIIVVGIVFSFIISRIVIRSIIPPLTQALHLAQNVAKGNLTHSLQGSTKDEAGILLNELNNMTVSLRDIVSQVRDGASAISTATSQLSAGNSDLSARTEHQASSLEETVSSMEQLTSTLKNTAENTHRADALASEASKDMQDSTATMKQVTEKMRDIRDSSRRMVEIIGTIDGIAFQTNILALNAAVEAARAGEQGRGFAVVAGEVRNLAQRSALAAKEIKVLIDNSVDKIHEGMEMVETAESSIGALVDNASTVGQIMNEIARASGEQSEGINQINIAIGQIDMATQQNVSLVEQSTAATQSLQDLAQQLSASVSTFILTDSIDTPQFINAPQRLLTGLPAATSRL